MIYDNANEVVIELFKSIFLRYQAYLETSERRSYFNLVWILYYKGRKNNYDHRRSYIIFPDWKKRKKRTTNPIKGDDKCFQYAKTTTLYQEEIGKSSKRITKYLPFIKWYKWEVMKYPSGKED